VCVRVYDRACHATAVRVLDAATDAAIDSDGGGDGDGTSSGDGDDDGDDTSSGDGDDDGDDTFSDGGSGSSTADSDATSDGDSENTTDPDGGGVEVTAAVDRSALRTPLAPPHRTENRCGVLSTPVVDPFALRTPPLSPATRHRRASRRAVVARSAPRTTPPPPLYDPFAPRTPPLSPRLRRPVDYGNAEDIADAGGMESTPIFARPPTPTSTRRVCGGVAWTPMLLLDPLAPRTPSLSPASRHRRAGCHESRAVAVGGAGRAPESTPVGDAFDPFATRTPPLSPRLRRLADSRGYEGRAVASADAESPVPAQRLQCAVTPLAWRLAPPAGTAPDPVHPPSRGSLKRTHVAAASVALAPLRKLARRGGFADFPPVASTWATGLSLVAAGGAGGASGRAYNAPVTPFVASLLS
jgi:hypothetical protein